ncbi:MAG: DUF4350 domain-containing protein [Chloroflexota bacterium]
MELRRRLIMLPPITIILLALIVWFYPSSADFRLDNPGWNGLEKFVAEFNASPATHLQRSSLPPGRTALVVVPLEKFTEPELLQLKDYVSSGGMLAVFDDYGNGNQLLDYLGLEARFTGRPLLDPLFNHKSEWLPRIMDLPAIRVARGVESVVLNHPSSLAGVSRDEVLARSSAFSFLDLDGDGAPGETEPTGPLPVLARVMIGKGSVVLMADPSILINGMIDIGDNRAFLRNVLDIGGAGARVFVDESHHGKAPLDEAKKALAVTHGALSAPLGMMGLVGTVLTLSLRPIWQRKGERVG